MNKKTFVSFLFLLLPLVAAADEVQINGLWYNIDSNGNTAQVIQYKDDVKYEGDIEIPSAVIYDGVEYSVTSIGDQAFRGCSSLTAISIPEEVTSIGMMAFYGCSSLTRAEFSSIESLCTTYINDSYSTPLYYAHHLFINGEEVTEVIIPSSVTSIGRNTFCGCSSLTGITIPQGVTNIGSNAFYGCSNLTKAEFSSIESLLKIKFYDKFSNPLYYAHHLFINGEEVTNVRIPDSVTSIGNFTFYNCSSLTEINIPQGVTTIGREAFNGCTGLYKAEYSSIESLCNIDFSDRYSNPLPYTGHLFINGEEVSNVMIPTSVTSIGDYTFSGCYYLTGITIPDGVVSIGNGAFYCCGNLTRINIPNLVTSIGNETFYNCKRLAEITIPASVTNIGASAFRLCSSLTEINIPDGITSIQDYTFYGCTSLTEISIPQGVTSIGASAFNECSNLLEIIIPQGVTSIGASAFYECSNLTRITIPDSVISIGGSAFSWCTNLLSIVCLGITPASSSLSTFQYVPTQTCILYVPAESIEAYSTTSPWSSFTNIQPLEVNGISEEEWAILGAIKDDLVEKGWSKPWDMSIGINLAESLQGITVTDKHVTQLNLSNSHLNGSFPFIVLQLPYLEQLNLSNNQLNGDVCTGIDATNSLPLTIINLSHNQLTGNIGAFASHFPQLQSLDASYNGLTEVDPMIPSSVTDLNIGYQSINQVYDFDLTNPSHDYLFQQIPSLLRYDHASQSYKNTIKLLCTTGDVATYSTNNSNDEWGAELTLDHEQGGWSIPFVSSNYAFQGENGSQLQAMLLNDNRYKTGNTFGLTLHFASGDANFDGDVDVTDLQASILEIMAQHGRTPFNFTAANINNDNDLNVLDIICQVNQLMGMDPQTSPRANKLKANVTTTHNASVYVDGSDLMLYSNTPIAAFDIRVSNASLLSLSEMLTLVGMTCSIKESSDGLHLIGYSLSGGLLPTGETCIATLKGTAPAIVAAVLADEQAEKVATTCNQRPTGIAIIGSAQVDIHQDGHQVAINTDGSGGTLFWQLTSSDGRVLGKGEADNGDTCTIPIDIRHHGLLIVTVRSANKTLINKLINIR